MNGSIKPAAIDYRMLLSVSAKGTGCCAVGGFRADCLDAPRLSTMRRTTFTARLADFVVHIQAKRTVTRRR